MRAIDDKIIYKLNTSVPTQSFAGQVSAEECCKQLYEEVRGHHRPALCCTVHCIVRCADEGSVFAAPGGHPALH